MPVECLRPAGSVEQRNDKTIIHLMLLDMPDPANTRPAMQANVAVVKEFVRRFPKIFAERYRDKYRANPGKYGRFDWDHVDLELHRVSGITIGAGAAQDSRPLMAIAGGVLPDVIFVNFRQSDTYIQQGFLYPLDLLEDGYFPGLTVVSQDHP